MHPYSQPVSEFVELRAPVRRRPPAPKSSALAQNQMRQVVLFRMEQCELIVSLGKCGNSSVLAAALFVLETGLGPRELLRITWEGIDWERRSLTRSKPCSKNYMLKVIFLSPEAMGILQDLGPGKPSEPIFDITQEVFNNSFKLACCGAGRKDVTVNDWRRTTVGGLVMMVGRSVLRRSTALAPITPPGC